jgi:hypothetical protein
MFRVRSALFAAAAPTTFSHLKVDAANPWDFDATTAQWRDVLKNQPVQVLQDVLDNSKDAARGSDVFRRRAPFKDLMKARKH